MLMKPLLIIALLFGALFSKAQDNNTLAKIAYEDAEAALNAGDLNKAVDNINKASALIGKPVPKIAYLNVQVRKAAMETYKTEAVYIVLIEACRSYLDLAKSYDLPEDKVMEVTRLLLKVQEEAAIVRQNEKAAAAQQAALDKRKAEADAIAKQLVPALVNLIDSLSTLTSSYQPGETIEALKQKRPDVSPFMTKYADETGLSIRRDDAMYRKKGITLLKWDPATSKVISFREIIGAENQKNAKKADQEALQQKAKAYMDLFRSLVNQSGLSKYGEGGDIRTKNVVLILQPNRVMVMIRDPQNEQNERDFYLGLDVEGDYQYLMIDSGLLSANQAKAFFGY